MPSLFDDLMADVGVPALLEQLGETVTYTPDGGSGTEIKGIVDYEEMLEDDAIDGRRKRRARGVTITTNPSGPFGGVAAPGLRDTVTIDGVEYAITNVDSQSANVADLSLVRRSSVEVSGREYRDKG